jgi:hypothetical protein
MIHRLYNPWQITNDGEREADRHLVLPMEMAGEIVYVLHSLRISSRYHRVQMSGECDFVIYTTKGIMEVEVKTHYRFFAFWDKTGKAETYEKGSYENIQFR